VVGTGKVRAVTPAAFRKLALSMPEAEEAPHFERTSFRVAKKIFATMTRDGAEAMVKVPAQERVRELLAAHPDTFFAYGGWTWKLGALGVRLRAAPAKLLRELVTQAWLHVAPRRLLP
jgi:hypothetical protein